MGPSSNGSIRERVERRRFEDENDCLGSYFDKNGSFVSTQRKADQCVRNINAQKARVSVIRINENLYRFRIISSFLIHHLFSFGESTLISCFHAFYVIEWYKLQFMSISASDTIMLKRRACC